GDRRKRRSREGLCRAAVADRAGARPRVSGTGFAPVRRRHHRAHHRLHPGLAGRAADVRRSARDAGRTQAAPRAGGRAAVRHASSFFYYYDHDLCTTGAELVLDEHYDVYRRSEYEGACAARRLGKAVLRTSSSVPVLNRLRLLTCCSIATRCSLCPAPWSRWHCLRLVPTTNTSGPLPRGYRPSRAP